MKFNEIQQNLWMKLSKEFVVGQLVEKGKVEYTVTELEETVANWIKQAKFLESGGFDPKTAMGPDHWSLNDNEIEEVLFEFKSQHNPVIDEWGVTIQGIDDEEELFEPWYSKAEFDMPRWKRYAEFLTLKQKLAKDSVNELDKDSDTIVGMLQNPNLDGKWERRGLVLGNVQQGKTANYTAVINKAVDTGYKVIVLLAGTQSSLRDQTQKRIDEGVIGVKGDNINIKKEKIGVGLIPTSLDGNEPEIVPHTYAAGGDLAKSTAMAAVNIEQLPHIFVIKKNTHILQNLIDSFSNINMMGSIGGHSSKLSWPLLVIDDEADNASVNTNKQEEDPTAINAKIREFLELFERKCFVGYTATPFANIFIDHRSDDDMLGHDLFPTHFIHVLSVPNNYQGPESLFTPEGPSHHIREIDDNDPSIPLKHKIDHEINYLPDSLVTALNEFIIITTIRSIKDTGIPHSTMLVNASWYVRVIQQLTHHIDMTLSDIKNAVDTHSKRPTEQALTDPYMQDLNNAYNILVEESNSLEDIPDWDSIQSKLNYCVQKINVIQVAGQSAYGLNYDSTLGNYLIAVGGYSLSRGLTLEGLCCSYLMRTTKQSDTLLQMGRWFGYRDGYSELCRMWLDEDTITRLEMISRDISELRVDLRKMADLKLTPKDFGLRVRSHPGFLNVTSSGKMRSTFKGSSVRLAGQVLQTSYIKEDPSILSSNRNATNEFVARITSFKECTSARFELYREPLDIFKDKLSDNGRTKLGYWSQNVNVDIILEFLNSYTNDPRSRNTNEELKQYILDRRKELEDWDVLIASNVTEEHVITLGDTIKINTRGRRAVRGSGSYHLATIQKGQTQTGGVAMLNNGDWGFGLTDSQLIQSKQLLDEGADGKGQQKYQNKARGKPALICQPTRITNSNNSPWVLDPEWVSLWAIQLPDTEIGNDHKVYYYGTVMSGIDQEDDYPDWQEE